MTEHSYVGVSIPRREDLPLITGRGRYAGDLHPDRLLHLEVVRSIVPHGVVKGVDLEVARSMPAVVGAYSASDLPEIKGPIVDTTLPDVHVAGRPVLAKERVRYVGEPVAIVVAETAYAAADAAAAVVIETEPLAAAADVVSALASGLAPLHPPHETNLAGTLVRVYGDIDEAFGKAAHIVRHRFRLARVAGGFIEPRACCGDWSEESGTWTVWTSTQWVHGVRDTIATVLGVEPGSVRVRAENVGGGFGPKGAPYPEEVLVAALARRLKRPVQWVATRSEDMASSLQAHGDIFDVELALDAGARILGLRAHLLHDIGAYAGPGAQLSQTITNHLVSAYRIPAYRAQIDLVYTNAVPAGFVRGGGREVGNFAIERSVDLVAASLGLDRVEIRRRNLIRPEDMPYDTGLPMVVYDGGDYGELLERVSAAVEPERGSNLLGVGISMSVERTGIGIGEEARLIVEADGSVTAHIGSTPGGQGHETTFAQVVATSLGWPLDKVRVTSGDTAWIGRAAVTAASRSAFEVGNAAAMAATSARKRLLEKAAQLLEADVADLVLSSEGVHVRGSPARAVGLAPILGGGPLEVSETFKQPPAYASACHAAVVEIDAETGTPKIVRYVIGHDSGRSINPALVEGQLHGGYAHGVGYALFEESVYDSEAMFVSSTFLDYAIPSAPELSLVPEMVKVKSEVFNNPQGFKGAGESATIPAPAAIAGAIEDALRKLGSSAVIDAVPITPMRISRALGREV